MDRGPTQAPTLTYDGGITTTSEPRNAPRRTAVPPGTIRHGPPPRSVRGGTAARSLKVNGPTVQSTVVRSAKQARIAVLTSKPHPPAVRGGRDRARRPGSDRARGRRGPLTGRARRPADGASTASPTTNLCFGLQLRGHATASRAGRDTIRPPVDSRRPRAAQRDGHGRPAVGIDREQGRADHVRLEEPHQRERRFDRHRVGPAAEVALEQAAASVRGSAGPHPSPRHAPPRTARPARRGSRSRPPTRHRRRPSRGSAASTRRRPPAPPRRAAGRGRCARSGRDCRLLP